MHLFFCLFLPKGDNTLPLNPVSTNLRRKTVHTWPNEMHFAWGNWEIFRLPITSMAFCLLVYHLLLMLSYTHYSICKLDGSLGVLYIKYIYNFTYKWTRKVNAKHAVYLYRTVYIEMSAVFSSWRILSNLSQSAANQAQLNLTALRPSKLSTHLFMHSPFPHSFALFLLNYWEVIYSLGVPRLQEI